MNLFFKERDIVVGRFDAREQDVERGYIRANGIYAERVCLHQSRSTSCKWIVNKCRAVLSQKNLNELRYEFPEVWMQTVDVFCPLIFRQITLAPIQV